jgi:hypothetical protein
MGDSWGLGRSLFVVSRSSTSRSDEEEMSEWDNWGLGRPLFVVPPAYENANATLPDPFQYSDSFIDPFQILQTNTDDPVRLYRVWNDPNDKFVALLSRPRYDSPPYHGKEAMREDDFPEWQEESTNDTFVEISLELSQHDPRREWRPVVAFELPRYTEVVPYHVDAIARLAAIEAGFHSLLQFRRHPHLLGYLPLGNGSYSRRTLLSRPTNESPKYEKETRKDDSQTTMTDEPAKRLQEWKESNDASGVTNDAFVEASLVELSQHDFRRRPPTVASKLPRSIEVVVPYRETVNARLDAIETGFASLVRRTNQRFGPNTLGYTSVGSWNSLITIMQSNHSTVRQ